MKNVLDCADKILYIDLLFLSNYDNMVFKNYRIGQVR
jgi:hypothetical protein